MEKHKGLLIQIIRFAFVGGSAFVIDYGTMIFLTEVLKINYLVSSGISFMISVVYNYILSIKWVFNVKNERNKKLDFIVFLVLSAIGLTINQFIMWFTVEKLGVFYMLAKIGATGVVMVYNFITRKLFLEKMLKKK